MLRFIPDSFTDGLLRPLLLGDPVVGLYLETLAPDWRFALLLTFLAIAAAGWAWRRRATATHRAQPAAAFLTAAQARALIGLTLCFYLWTFVSGNGRYFMWALVAVGPLVVVAARRLPATRAMRNTVIIGALVVQGIAVSMTYQPNLWGLRMWREGPALALARTPLQDKPAIFLTIGFISYSILVPQMHPQSRWANITGQREIVPGVFEYPRLQALLNSPLPKYVMFNAAELARGPGHRPLPEAARAMQHIMRQQNLRPLQEECEYVGAPGGVPGAPSDRPRPEDGFWFCAVEPMQAGGAAEAPPPVAPELDDIFEKVEEQCPRFLPKGSARSRLSTDGVVVRHYTHSDTTVYINEAGDVYFKYFRALNPSVIGEVHEVRQGHLTLDCARLPGRYVPPWDRD